MKKRRLAAILALALAATTIFAGCDKSSDDASSASAEDEIQTYEPGSRTPESVAETLPEEDSPKITYENMRGISLKKGDEIVYQINYTPQAERETFLYWDMVEPWDSTTLLNTEEMEECFGVLDYMDFAAASVDGLELGTVEDTLTITYCEYSEDQAESEDDEDSDDSSQGQIEPDFGLTLLIGAPDATGNYPCAIEGREDQVFYMNGSYMESLLNETAYDLILKVPYVMSYTAIKRVDITYDGKTKRIYHSEKNDLYHFGHTKVSQDDYTAFYQELMDPMISGQIEEGTDFGDDREPVLTLSYVRNYEGASDFVVDIYDVGDNTYTIAVNGEENFYLDSEEVETLINNVAAHFAEY